MESVRNAFFITSPLKVSIGSTFEWSNEVRLSTFFRSEVYSMRRTFVAFSSLCLGLLLLAQPALARNNGLFEYEITVTNLTQGQWFTPILGIGHRPNFALPEAGQIASGTPLETLAETGNPGPLAGEVGGESGVNHTTIAPDPNGLAGVLLPPGQSVTFTLPATRTYWERISLVAMLTPTNDAFFALRGARTPFRHQTVTYFAQAYDAGTEVNSEICAEIPGPPPLAEILGCTLDSSSDASTGTPEDGVIHIHNGIHGAPSIPNSGLNPMNQDWNNPVAKVVIQRIRGY